MWLEVSKEIAIDADSIISVEKLSQMESAIYTESRMYKVSMPKSVLMTMIDSKKTKDSMGNVERLLMEMYKGQMTPRP